MEFEVTLNMKKTLIFILVIVFVNAIIPFWIFDGFDPIKNYGHGSNAMYGIVNFILIFLHLLIALSIVFYNHFFSPEYNLNKIFRIIAVSNCLINFGWLTKVFVIDFLIKRLSDSPIHYPIVAYFVLGMYFVTDLCITWKSFDY